MQKAEMLNELKRMLNDVLMAKTKGVSYQRLARAHGYVDGYMKALLDSGVASQQELLTMVAEERAAVDGPASESATRRCDDEVAELTPGLAGPHDSDIASCETCIRLRNRSSLALRSETLSLSDFGGADRLDAERSRC